MTPQLLVRTVAVCLAVSAGPFLCAASAHEPGDRVEVDVNMASASDAAYASWKAGTITKVDVRGKAYFVKLDSGQDVVIPMREPDRWIRTAAAPAKRSGASGGSGSGGVRGGVRADGGTVRPSRTAPSPAATPRPKAGSGGGGGEFTSKEQCVVGARVSDRRNRAGRIVSVDGTLCRVRLDDGTEIGPLFWMLRPEGASTGSADALTPGRYKCYSSAGGSTNYLFVDIVIAGPSSYQDGSGAAGRYRLEPSGRIVFESGPFTQATAKLLPGPKLGINFDGGSFFSTTCDPER